MIPTDKCSIVRATKDQMVSFEQTTNAISATSSYIQDILNEVLHKEKNGEINSIAGFRPTKQQQQYSVLSSS